MTPREQNAPLTCGPGAARKCAAAKMKMMGKSASVLTMCHSGINGVNMQQEYV